MLGRAERSPACSTASVKIIPETNIKLTSASASVCQAVGHQETNCQSDGLSIIGLAKFLAYGDFLKASQLNGTISSVLDAEISNYPYSRKTSIRVKWMNLHY